MKGFNEYCCMHWKNEHMVVPCILQASCVRAVILWLGPQCLCTGGEQEFGMCHMKKADTKQRAQLSLSLTGVQVPVTVWGILHAGGRCLCRNTLLICWKRRKQPQKSTFTAGLCLKHKAGWECRDHLFLFWYKVLWQRQCWVLGFDFGEIMASSYV